jgi:GAF domain-containing protein
MRKDPTRLAELRRLMILDSTPGRAFDDITRLLSTQLEVPIAIVNLLDAERDWFKSCVGLPQLESPASTSFCETFFHDGANLVVVDDTTTDARFASHPLVVGAPFVRFYAAARLTVDGQTLGTLCAYDVKPRRVSSEQLQQLRTLAEAAVDAIRRRRVTPAVA